jgi:hypothetical protein
MPLRSKRRHEMNNHLYHVIKNIGSLFAFVLGIWFAHALFSPLFAQNPFADVTLDNANATPAAGGGPDVWYDYQDPDLASDQRTLDGAFEIAEDVNFAQGGTVTKLRAYIDVYAGDADLKLALYSGTTLLSYGTVTVTSTGWFEATLLSPQSVAAGNYGIAAESANNNISIRVKTSESGKGPWASLSYASFPADPLPSLNGPLNEKMCVGAYVD